MRGDEETRVVGRDEGLRAVSYVQLGEDPADGSLDGGRVYDERRGDVPVGQASVSRRQHGAATLPFLGMLVGTAGGDHGGSIVLGAVWVILERRSPEAGPESERRFRKRSEKVRLGD